MSAGGTGTVKVSDSVEFGRAIRALRKDRGFTQQELADYCGCSIMFVSNLERGKRTAELGLALRVVNTLSADVEIVDRRRSNHAS